MTPKQFSTAGRSMVFLGMIFLLAFLTLGDQAVVAQQATVDAATVSPEMEKRIEQLESRLEAEREKMHIPGMALCVVKDGKVVFAKGFGVCDVENNKPVTPETLFAIGSSTKAFTATMIGMLVDDGTLNFDDPVSKHIPGFELQVDTGDEQVTFRDLLCHRTGFTRMGVLWAAGTSTRPAVIAHAANAKPTKKFREAFQYNNVMYMTAGYAAGLATGSTWEEQIASRILKPLGMNGSNTSVELSQQDPRLSLGYRWDEDAEEFELLPMRNLDLIGPAGSINSNVVDMAQWLKFQLADGQINGKQLIAKETLEETRKPQIEMGAGADYGLGWMLRKWNKKQVVEHGGNIDGFGAQVALLPEENLGYVLLTNVTATPLQGGSIEIVFDSLVGELDKMDDVAALDTDDLVGVYEAGFGGLKDKKLTVQLKDGKLAIDVPGQTVFELKSPDEEGKWYFALTDTIAISFDTSGDGPAKSLTLHQAGLNIECPREGVERDIEVPLEELRTLIGKYKDPDQDKDVEFIIYKNRLAVILGPQGTMEFFPPDDDGLWAFRAKRDAFQVRFNKNAEGVVETVTRIQGGKETEMKRVAESADQVVTLPSGDEIIQKIRDGFGIDAETEIGNIKMEGTVSFVNQGAKGRAGLVFSGTDAHMTNMDLGHLGYIRASYDGQRGWTESAFSPFDELTGDDLAMAKLRHPIWIAGEWSSHYEKPNVTRQDELDGKTVYVVLFTGKEIPNRTIYVDAESGLIWKEDTAVLMPGIGSLPVTIKYSNYQSAGDIVLPFEVSSENAANGQTLVQYDVAKSVSTKPNYVLKDPKQK